MALLTRIRAVLARYEDRSAWPPGRRDWLLVAGWLAVGAFDVALENDNGLSFTHPDPTPAQTWPLLVIFTLLVLLRRRTPLLALALAYILICFASLVGGHLDKGFVPVAMIAVLQFCATRQAPTRRDAFIAAGVGVLGVVAATFAFSGSQSVGDMAWATGLLIVLPFAAARAYRHQEVLAGLLRERTAQLEVQRDERARLAVAQERERIAAELHDVVAHGVSGMVVQAAAARRLVERRGDTPAAHEAIGAVEASGRAALEELRRLLGVLRRGDEALALAPQPSLARVDRLVARLREEGLPVELAVEGRRGPLPPGLDMMAYRIIEEALAEVLRAGDASATRVGVRYGERELELEVADDGAHRGDEGDDGRLGLRERVALFGGELTAGPRRRGGWALHARLPVERVGA